MTKKTLQLEPLSCPSCMAKIEGMLKKTKGVSHAEVLFNSSRLKLEFDEAVTDVATLTNNIGNLGYEVLGER